MAQFEPQTLGSCGLHWACMNGPSEELGVTWGKSAMHNPSLAKWNGWDETKDPPGWGGIGSQNFRPRYEAMIGNYGFFADLSEVFRSEGLLGREWNARPYTASMVCCWMLAYRTALEADDAVAADKIRSVLRSLYASFAIMAGPRAVNAAKTRIWVNDTVTWEASKLPAAWCEEPHVVTIGDRQNQTFWQLPVNAIMGQVLYWEGRYNAKWNRQLEVPLAPPDADGKVRLARPDGTVTEPDAVGADWYEDYMMPAMGIGSIAADRATPGWIPEYTKFYQAERYGLTAGERTSLRNAVYNNPVALREAAAMVECPIHELYRKVRVFLGTSGTGVVTEWNANRNRQPWPAATVSADGHAEVIQPSKGVSSGATKPHTSISQNTDGVWVVDSSADGATHYIEMPDPDVGMAYWDKEGFRLELAAEPEPEPPVDPPVQPPADDTVEVKKSTLLSWASWADDAAESLLGIATALQLFSKEIRDQVGPPEER